MAQALAAVSSFNPLPFIARRRGHLTRHWQVAPIDDYERACDVGREYADRFVNHLKANPREVGWNVLGHIAGDIDFKDPSAARGYWVGFFTRLEHLIAEAS